MHTIAARFVVSHSSLLENSFSLPFISSTQLGTVVIQILCAEYVFSLETAGIAGMDEQCQPSGVSFVDIGLEMARSRKAGQSKFAHPSRLSRMYYSKPGPPRQQHLPTIY